MRFKLTLVLLLANLAVFFVLWRLNQPPEIIARPAGPIPKDNFDIDHIIIDDNVPADTRELTRDRSNINVWHLVKPVSWLADVYAVGDLKNQLQFLDDKAEFSIKDLEKSGQSLKDYGLDHPAVKITVYSGANSTELDIGRLSPVGNNLYVMNPKDGLVRVVDESLLKLLDKPLGELEDKRLFTIGVFAVQRLSITAAGTGTAPATSFTRFVLDGDQWRMDTPFSCAAHYDSVNAVIKQLTNLRAESFVPMASATSPSDLAHYGLTAPFLKIELKGDSSDPSQELWLGSTVPGATAKEYYAKLADNPTVVEVKDSNLFATLLDAQNALRERQFLDFSPEKVSTINIQFSTSAEVQMEMLENHTWQIVDKDNTTPAPNIAADAGIITTLLDNLHDLSAKSFASDAPSSDDLQNTFDLKNPQWKVILQGDKSFKPITLDIGISPVAAPSTGAPSVRYYAKIEGADSVYEIDGEIIGQLSTNPLHFRDRMLEKLPAGAQIISLKLTHLTDDDLTTGKEVINYTIDPAKTTWEEFLKDKPGLIKDNLPTVRDFVRQFEVDTYRQAKFDEHYQMELAGNSTSSIAPTPIPWRYRLDAGVQLTAPGGGTATTETLTFFFSDRYGSLRLGGTKDAPLPAAIFTLPIALNGALGTIIQAQEQPEAAVQTLREVDQPINPAAAVPADSSEPTSTGSPSTPSTPAGNAQPAPPAPTGTPPAASGP